MWNHLTGDIKFDLLTYDLLPHRVERTFSLPARSALPAGSELALGLHSTPTPTAVNQASLTTLYFPYALPANRRTWAAQNVTVALYCHAGMTPAEEMTGSTFWGGYVTAASADSGFTMTFG